jgi:hypothetical protein
LLTHYIILRELASYLVLVFRLLPFPVFLFFLHIALHVPEYDGMVALSHQVEIISELTRGLLLQAGLTHKKLEKPTFHISSFIKIENFAHDIRHIAVNGNIKSHILYYLKLLLSA